MNKVKILHIHTLPIVSGSGINVYLSMVKIDRDKFLPELACAPNGRLIDLVSGAGIRVRSIDNLVRHISPMKDFLALLELIRLLKRERYDIVHTHNSKAGFLGRLATRFVKVPLVIHTVHGFSFHPYENFLRRKIFVFLERLAASWSDKMIFISQPLIEWAKKEKICKDNKIIKIYSGIPLEDFSQNFDVSTKRIELGIRDSELVIGCVAKLWHGKGQDILLKAVQLVIKEIPDIKVLIVGEGGEEKNLKTLAKRLNLEDKVKFMGFRWDIPQITACLDVACLVSFWEGMGRAILEAMASAKPVVATKVGGIVDLVQDGLTGFLVSPGDPKALAIRIIELLKDKNLRYRMGENARRQLNERFSAEKMAEQIAQVYQKMLEKRC